MAERPLTFDEVMEILRTTVPRLDELTRGVPQKRLTTVTDYGWSVNDQLAHLRACHDVLGGNMLRIVREDHPAWKGAAWQKQTDYFEWKLQPAFEAFRAHGHGERAARQGLRVQRALLRRVDGPPRAQPPEAHRADPEGTGMSNATIRPAYSKWPEYNQALRDVVAGLTDEQLAMRPSPQRWPLWATVGHACCQRVFWLCDFAGEPGADTTPFTDAGNNCPGDDDLENVLSADALVEALDSSFRIVEGCLDRWTLDMLDEELRRPEWDETWVHTRGSVLQRVFSHDVYHAAQLNDVLGEAGLPQIDFWD